MKKFLLTLAGMACMAGAWAATDYGDLVDITPNYFKFNTAEVDIDDMVRDDNTKYIGGGGAHLGDSFIITNNLDEEGDKFFTSKGLENGNVLFGAWVHNNNQRTNFKNGFSIYDFGGKIGKALVINGSNSDLAKAIEKNFNLEEEPDIPKCVEIKNNLIMFWLLNHLPLKDPASEYSKIRVKFELNAYHNDYSSDKWALSNFFYQNEQAAPIGSQDPVVKFNDFAKEGEWNPYKWMVIEEDFVPEDITIGAFLKLGLNNGAPTDFNGGAYIIRNIEFFAVPKDHESELEENTPIISWNDYTPETVLPDIIDGNVSNTASGVGFNVTFTEQLTEGEGEITITSSEEVTDMPIVTSNIDGNVLTVYIEGEEAGTYTVTVPEGFVKVGSNGINAKVEKTITIEKKEEPTPEGKAIAGDVAVENNVLTVTFESVIAEVQVEGKEVTVTPAKEGKTPIVAVGEKVITVTLTDFPADKYTVTIPEGFVTVGENDYNAEVVENIEIKESAIEPDPTTYPIDITPAYYKFNTAENVNLDEMINPEVKFKNGFNLQGEEISGNLDDQGEGWFTTEGLANGYIAFGAWIMNNNAVNDIKEGMTITDFGGEIGKALVINGSESKLNEVLERNYGKEDAPVVGQATRTLANNFVMYFLVNHKNEDLLANYDKKLRLRVELNTYNNSNANNALSSIKLFNESNNNFGEAKAIDNANFLNENGAWDPTKWMVYEVDFTPANIAQPEVIKFDLTTMASSDDNFNTGAIMIRNLELFVVDESENVANKPNISYITLALPEGITPEEPTYAAITALTLSHNQENTFELSGTDKAEITMAIETEDGEEFDPETEFMVVVDNNDAEHVSVSEIEDGKFTVSVAETAAYGEVGIYVKAGEVKSNSINLLHYAAPSHVALNNDAIEIGENNSISMKADDDAIELTANVVSKHETQEGAYQKFVLNVGQVSEVSPQADEVEAATIKLNESNNVVITPKAVGEVSFTVTPVTAGEDKTGATTYSTEGTTYTVRVGVSAIEVINQNSGDVEYYDLNGRRINKPGNGIFIRKQGDKTTKVMVK